MFRQILCLFAILISVDGYAVEKTLSWDEAVKKAAEANEDLQSSQRSLESYQEQVKGSYSDYFPQLSASLNYTYGNTSSSSGSAVITSSNQGDYSATLSATENVFSGFYDAGKIAQAKANREVALTTYQSTKARVSNDLVLAVTDLLYAKNYVKLSQSIIQRRELNLKTVQLRFESGRENKGSLLLSKAYLEDARLDELRAKQALDVAQGQLAKVLGDEDILEYNLTGNVPQTEPPADGILDFKKLAVETPTYQQAVAQESLANSGVTLAESGFYPTLGVNASANNYGVGFYPSDSNHWSVGATLNIPLFSGGKDYYSARSALASLKSSILAKSSTFKDQIVKLKSAYVAYVQAVQKLKVDQAYMEAALSREKISREKYNNGLSTFDDWDIIENDLINRQKTLIASERDRIESESAWQQALGKGVLP